MYLQVGGAGEGVEHMGGEKEMTHTDDEGGRVGQERKPAKWEEREGTDGVRGRCREVQERVKRGERAEERERGTSLSGLFSPPCSSGTGSRQAIRQNSAVFVLLEPSH